MASFFKTLIALRRGEPIQDSRGFATRRFAEYIEQLTEQTNTNTSDISGNSFIEVFALISDINNRLGSGDALTSDSDSFTVDSTELFVDLTEA